LERKQMYKNTYKKMPTILSTKKLDKHQAQLLLHAGINYVSYDAIRISFSKNIKMV